MFRFALWYLIALTLCSCGKKGCEFEGGYEFIIPAELGPRQDTFQIGDTIHFISEFDDLVPEKNTSQSYRLVDFSFYPTTGVNKIDEAPSTLSGLDDFQVVIDSVYSYSIQRFSSGTVKLSGSYFYDKGKYTLKFDLIPMVTGLYRFTHNSNLIHDYGGDQDFEGKCRSERIREILVRVNEGYHNNIDLLKDSPDPTFNSAIFNKPQEKFYEEGAYVFYVAE